MNDAITWAIMLASAVVLGGGIFWVYRIASTRRLEKGAALTFEQKLALIATALQVGYFVMMALGLLIVTGALAFSKVTGGEWVTTCLGLFGASHFSHSLTQIGANLKGRASADDTIRR